MKPLLVFDMDGVLVDVTESYREAIAQTAAYFTGAPVPHERIQEYKNRGGFNDDWELTHRLVRDSGVEASFEEVKQRFQLLFLGERPGSTSPAPEALIMRERWIARPGVLERLSERFRLAVFTGRPREEAAITLDRFAGGLKFDPVIAMEDVGNHKPHPEGLLCTIGAATVRERIVSASGRSPLPDDRGSEFYIGDSVDDARCARAAGVPFIGIAAPSNPCYLDLVFLFQDEKAYAIVDDINYLEEALPE